MNSNSLIHVAALASALAAAACAATTPIPGELDPGTNTALAMVVPAKGVQIYECRRKKDADQFEWAFVAPDAELFDTRGNVIGRHGAGPFWQAADGSRVTAKVKARSDAPAGNAIPWLLLEAKDSGMPGSFSKVAYIQRVNTQGGLAPSKPCAGEFLGQQMGVHYTADYRLFVQLAAATYMQKQ